MPRLLSQLTGDEIKAGAPLTPAMRFFFDYVSSIDGYLWQDSHSSGSKYYHQQCVFHNTNNANYTGPDEMWGWINKIFGQFEALRHDIHEILDIEQDDGTSMITMRAVRNIWIKGSTSKDPEVSAPTVLWARIGKGDSPNAFEGLQFHEVWLYWDTMLLAPYMDKDAIAFQAKNVMHEK